MKILVINYEFPPVGGGGGDVSKNLSLELAKAGHSVHVVTSWVKGLMKKEEIDGYTVQRINVLRKRKDRCSLFEMALFILIGSLHCLHIARKFRPDIIHCHFGMPVGPIGYLIYKIWGVRYILTLHGSDVPGHDQRVLNLYSMLTPFIRKVYKNAARMVVVSDHFKKMVSEGLRIQAPIEVIHNGVDTDFWSCPTPRVFSARPLRLLFVGRFSPEKGIDTLLDACRILKQQGIAFRLTLVGDGPERKKIEPLIIKNHIEPETSITGWLGKNEVRMHMCDSHIIIFPSLIEGFPTTAYLQALATGVVAMVSDIPGAQQYTVHTQQRFKLKDAQALAERIIYFSERPEMLESISRSSIELAQKNSWKSIALQYDTLFKKIAASNV